MAKVQGVKVETIERGLYKVNEVGGPTHFFDRKREAEAMVKFLKKEGAYCVIHCGRATKMKPMCDVSLV